MSSPIPSLVFRSEVHSYPKNIPAFFIYRRFEGVEALDACKNCKTYFIFLGYYTILLDLSASGIFNGMKTTPNFS
jgi:hypothetical protein